MLGPLLVLVFVAIAALYLFFISAGLVTEIPPQSHYFTVLADAFLDGHLYLGIAPSPELLATANPYDPANSRLWVWDATLHDGRYYLYWGPVPALLVAAAKAVAGRELFVGDELLVLAFVLGRLAVGIAILSLASRRLFPGLHPWLALPAVAVFGLANPYLFGLGRAGVYEAAIEGAQFFLLLGLLMGARAIGVVGSRRSQLALSSLAGCAWGAALACRISLVLAIGALALLTAWISSLGADRKRRELVLQLLCVGAPVVFAALGLAAYNQARFGSWTDFGAEHQLGYLPYSFSIARFPSTLHAYLLREVLVTCRFPYIFAPAGAGAMPPDWMFAKQTGYLSLEPTVGMLIAAPWVLFGLVALGSARRIYRQASRAAPGAAIDARDRLYLWLVTACFASALLAGVPALGMQFSTMRFLADFTSAALLMAAVGFWTLLSRAGSAGRRRAAHAAGALLGLYTVVFSILIGFQGGYYDSFHRWNPALRDRLLAGLSLCDAREDRRSGRRDPAVAPGERPVQRSARSGSLRRPSHGPRRSFVPPARRAGCPNACSRGWCRLPARRWSRPRRRSPAPPGAPAPARRADRAAPPAPGIPNPRGAPFGWLLPEHLLQQIRRAGGGVGPDLLLLLSDDGEEAREGLLGDVAGQVELGRRGER
jgi:hypothetical protein